MNTTDNTAQRLETLEARIVVAEQVAGDVANLMGIARTLSKKLDEIVQTSKTESTIFTRKVQHLTDTIAELQTTSVSKSAISKAISASLTPALEAIVTEVTNGENMAQERLKDAINGIRGEHQQLSVAINGAVAQLSAIAGGQIENASNRLLNAARFFSSGAAPRGSKMKADCLVESFLLRDLQHE